MLCSSPHLRGAISLCLRFSEFKDVSSKSRSFELFCRDGHFGVLPILDIKLLPVFKVDIIPSSFLQAILSPVKAELVKHLGDLWESGGSMG